MGWWETNEEGVSFEHSRDGMVWGDGPADEVDGALHAIRQQYIAEWGRLPSRTEIIAGLSFSLRVFLEHLPERPESSPLTEEEQQDYASALYKLPDPAISDPTRVRLQKIVADTEARFASEDDETDEESDEEFRARFPKLLSLMNDAVGVVFSTPGPEVGSEPVSDAQAPSSEDPATPHLTVVENQPGTFDKLKQWINRPVVARWQTPMLFTELEANNVVRGLLRVREGKSYGDVIEEAYLMVQAFHGKSASGSPAMEISPLTLDELTPQELRDWNLSDPVEFTRFVFEDHFTKGW
jgi:hypothetical protein